MKYLVIDDSKLARLSLVKSIKTNVGEVEIIQAVNGLEAIELVKEEKPDIAFLDLTMPVMDGYEALPKMLEVNPKLKVVVVSADVQEGAKRRVVELGAQFHVQKPINPEKMKDIFRDIIMQDLTLTEDEQDVLQELMNVAYGNATAVVAEMLDAFASLSIPIIKIMKTSELLEEFKALKGESYFFATQAFVGDFSGESAFFIDNQSAQNLASHLELESEDDLDDAILELTNVLTSSLTTRLAQEMQTEVKFLLPSISKVSIDEIEHKQTFLQYSQVIVIDTQLNFKDQKINGEIFILTKDGSIEWLKNQLNTILETLI